MTLPIVSVDFETKAIVPGGPLLPMPVGCSIEYLDESKPPRYWAWGHPTENNCTREEFAAELESIWGYYWITQNGAGFDVEVARHHFGLPKRDPLLTYDTLFESYLHDPHARSLKLKDLASEWLGMPPDEQQDLFDWIMENVPECKSRKNCGAYISEAPGSLVGRYAIGDTSRAAVLHSYLGPLIATMREPYERELRLAPILADIRNRGVRCDVVALCNAYVSSMAKLTELDKRIREKLHSPDLNVGSGDELAQALLSAGYKGFLLTPTGKPSIAAESLDKVLDTDPDLKSMLHSRGIYKTLTSTFMWPWIQYAKANGGRIHAAYNQVRNPEGYGTRTGRLSSSEPNFQNVPTEFEGVDYFGDPFPLMRAFLLPEEGHVWVCGDFKNQEPRLTAHFEDGALCAAFNENPDLDPYIFVCEVCAQPPKEFRKAAKVIFLGLVYAMGVAKLQAGLNEKGYPYNQAQAAMVKAQVMGALPDVVQLDKDCKARFRKGLPIRTLGGRLYYCEPPSNGRSWEYKALNTLIQGSAADQTKEALIYTQREIDSRPHLVLAGVRILGTVHDEWSVSTPPCYVDEVKAIMSAAANALPCDVPMALDFGVGNNWQEAA